MSLLSSLCRVPAFILVIIIIEFLPLSLLHGSDCTHVAFVSSSLCGGKAGSSDGGRVEFRVWNVVVRKEKARQSPTVMEWGRVVQSANVALKNQHHVTTQ
jgi:hypothetical protein